jgi:hypothetical protein
MKCSVGQPLWLPSFYLRSLPAGGDTFAGRMFHYIIFVLAQAIPVYKHFTVTNPACCNSLAEKNIKN